LEERDLSRLSEALLKFQTTLMTVSPRPELVNIEEDLRNVLVTSESGQNLLIQVLNHTLLTTRSAILEKQVSGVVNATLWKRALIPIVGTALMTGVVLPASVVVMLSHILYSNDNPVVRASAISSVAALAAIGLSVIPLMGVVAARWSYGRPFFGQRASDIAVSRDFCGRLLTLATPPQEPPPAL
jgi:hypothetical protein